ncbi:MAG: DUF4832 domain-containing protein [Bryobacterales bacterium]|nr:DUF4832 domain-containing protein [Bryobacterales bacterium]
MVKRVPWFAVLAAARMLLAAGAATVKFHEIDTVFQNPGKGWMAFGSPAREPRFPVSVAYLRLNWADLEPAEGQYNWAPLDGPITAWKERGARVAFRIMTTNAHSQGYYCSPKWLFDAGCRGFEYVPAGDDPTAGGSRIPRIEPDYSDPIYLSRHANFIRALGRRYDGHPAVEFLDIGSYGIWGEWHTPHPAPFEIRRKIIDMYLEAFRRTPLVAMSDDAQALAYAIPRGAGFRRDGVGSPSHEKQWIGSEKYREVPGFADAWKRAPAVFEWYGNYAYLQRRQWPFDRAVQFMLDNHVTLINDNVGAVPEEEMPKLWKLARLSGYRFVLRELTHTERVRPGGRLDIAMQWSNVGVGRLYREFPLELYLLDGKGAIAVKTRAAADPRTWLPGDHACAAQVTVPKDLPAGAYTLGLALVDEAGQPAIKLAIDAPETGRLYRLSTVTVR